MVQLKRHARGTGLREAIRRGRAAADCATRRWVHGTVLRMYGCTGLRPGRVPVIPNVLPFQAVGERGSTGRQALTRQSERRVPLRIGETGSGGSNVNGLVVGSRTAGAFTPGGGPPLSNFHRTLLQAVIGNTQGQSESLGLSAIRRPGRSRPPKFERGPPWWGPPPYKYPLGPRGNGHPGSASNIRFQATGTRVGGEATRSIAAQGGRRGGNPGGPRLRSHR